MLNPVPALLYIIRMNWVFLPIRNDSKNDSTNDEQARHDKKDGIAIIGNVTTRNAETVLTIMFIYFFDF